MSDDPQWNAALEPGFFDGRLLVDILSWDWPLRVAVSAPTTRLRSRFQGGLDYDRHFQIRGRIRAPAVLRNKRVEVTLSPFGPKVVFGRNGLKELGRLRAAATPATEFAASLMLPETAIATTAASLASNWKYLHLWTFDETHAGATISSFSFSATIHPNLMDWANAK